MKQLFLPHPVKMQLLHISNIIIISIKHAFPGQSIPMVNGCIDIMFDMVDIAFSYRKALIVC